jgi:hypothetical protein
VHLPGDVGGRDRSIVDHCDQTQQLRRRHLVVRRQLARVNVDSSDDLAYGVDDPQLTTIGRLFAFLPAMRLARFRLGRVPHLMILLFPASA